MQQLKDHLTNYVSPYTDLRTEVRRIEEELLSTHAGALIGNQCLDFGKQDGVTELEESIMANTVERRLNDLLLRDELDGRVIINRRPIYVSCVSNFTNFLDLFRKTIRSLELGIPCVVLSRSHTSQHAYRWTQLLVRLLHQNDLDPGMVTFVSCSLNDLKDLLHSCQDRTGNLYATSSRQLAADITSTYPRTIASTGGPNTMVVVGGSGKDGGGGSGGGALPPAIRKAIQTSASIESSGQCTALRHCVVGSSATDRDIAQVWETLQPLNSPAQALQESLFDGVFKDHEGSPVPEEGSHYQQSPATDAYYKVSDDLPSSGMNEYWRKVVVDFSRLDVASDKVQMDRLVAWLNENQPISLAVNGPRTVALKVGLELFARTGMVVNTIGSSDKASMPPALTCQARPQEAEIFGEFPPRHSLRQYTRFPVIVPSSNPSYDTAYTLEHLKAQSLEECPYFSQSTRALLRAVTDPAVRGYCILLIRYLQDACRSNPRLGFGQSRTAMWGWQRPPRGMLTVLHSDDPNLTWDHVAPMFLLFHVTNAQRQVQLSVDPANKELIAFGTAHRLPLVVETREQRHVRLQGLAAVHKARIDVEESLLATQHFPMVGNFVSLYFPLGHVKSTMAYDEEFVTLARLSDKWLNTNF